MRVSDLSDSAKVWVYQSNRAFTEAEKDEIQQLGDAFVNQWASHGTALRAGFEIAHSRFLILAVEEDQMKASGCSIDSSVNFIRQMENKFGVDLFDRMAVAYRQGEELQVVSLAEFKELAGNRIVSPDTLVFNNLISTVGEFKHSWMVPAKSSWHSSCF